MHAGRSAGAARRLRPNKWRLLPFTELLYNMERAERNKVQWLAIGSLLNHAHVNPNKLDLELGTRIHP